MGQDATLSYSTDLGKMWEGDSLEVLRTLDEASANLILTSPPFALTRAKDYGNEPEDQWVDWFMDFAREFKRVMADDGSLVIDLGGAWKRGRPTKSLYQYRLLVRLADDLGFHLAQEFFWFNRSKLPGPAQWVNIERTRVKDAVNVIWWLSKTPRPKASNLNVLKPYSRSMKKLLETGEYNAGDRPSEHVIGENWAQDNGGSIPPNVIEVAEALSGPISSVNEPDNMLDCSNTTSVGPYHAFCRANEIVRHPARFPEKVPEFFIRFLTDKDDLVVDPFGGSNVTGMIAEDLKRRWLTVELNWEYIIGSLGRFSSDAVKVHDEHIATMVGWPDSATRESDDDDDGAHEPPLMEW